MWVYWFGSCNTHPARKEKEVLFILICIKYKNKSMNEMMSRWGIQPRKYHNNSHQKFSFMLSFFFFIFVFLLSEKQEVNTKNKTTLGVVFECVFGGIFVVGNWVGVNMIDRMGIVGMKNRNNKDDTYLHWYFVHLHL